MNVDITDDMEAAKKVSALEAAQRRNGVLHDLRSLLGLASTATLRKRWRSDKVTAADLRWARKMAAVSAHPDRAADPVAANRQMALINDAIDQAIHDTKKGNRKS